MQQVVITYKLNEANKTIRLKTQDYKIINKREGNDMYINKENIRTAIINTFPLEFIKEYTQKNTLELHLLDEYMLDIQKEYNPLYLHDIRIEIETRPPFELKTTNYKVEDGSTTIETILNIINKIKEHFENVDRTTTIKETTIPKHNNKGLGKKSSTKGT